MLSETKNKTWEVLTPERLAALAAVVPGAIALLPNAEYLCSGVARVLFLDGQAVGFCGVFPLWPGVGEAWALFRPQALKHPRWIRRVALDGLNEARERLILHQIQCDADMSERHHSRWLISLGFEFEGVMRRYTFDKQDRARHAITYQEGL